MLQKPQTKHDLLPPFETIGEPNWDAKLRHVFELYEVPLPAPVSEVEIAQRENVLGIRLPSSFHLFLLAFGPVDFDGLRICLPTEVDRLEHVWFRSHLRPREQGHLAQLIQVAVTGSDDVYALDLRSQQCCRCSHDPGGFFDWLPTFDDLIRMAVIDLSWSYYGWPDDDIEAMAGQLKNELFWPDRLR